MADDGARVGNTIVIVQRKKPDIITKALRFIGGRDPETGEDMRAKEAREVATKRTQEEQARKKSKDNEFSERNK